jgi:hypothetical protein
LVGAYYRDVTRVHENKVAFVWERTFHHALRAFRDAVASPATRVRHTPPVRAPRQHEPHQAGPGGNGDEVRHPRLHRRERQDHPDTHLRQRDHERRDGRRRPRPSKRQRTRAAGGPILREAGSAMCGAHMEQTVTSPSPLTGGRRRRSMARATGKAAGSSAKEKREVRAPGGASSTGTEGEKRDHGRCCRQGGGRGRWVGVVRSCSWS